MPVHHDLAQRRAARALEPVPAVRTQAALTRRPPRRDGQEHRGSVAQEAVLGHAMVEGASNRCFKPRSQVASSWQFS